MTPFDGKCQNLQISSTHFCASAFCFRYITILNLYLEKVGQGHGVQLSQLCHSMAYVKIYKIYCLHFLFSLRCDLCERL